MVRMAGDGGKPVVLSAPESAAALAFRELAGKTAQQASIAALSKTK
jgi:MinD-like ATPase involved in chromosome partitioning or flagellar assembly